MLRIIGDIHGDYEKYKQLTSDSSYSVQVGDLGFHYTGKHIDDVDPYHHRFVGGNHDNYDIYDQTPRSLGDYGVVSMGGVDFMFIRGAFSIDWRVRQNDIPKTWWNNEQLSTIKMREVERLYSLVRPKVVITHTCPKSIADKIGKPETLRIFGYDPERFTTNTQELLERCLEIYQPRHWFFGHFHKTQNLVHEGVNFHCVGEYDFIDFEVNE